MSSYGDTTQVADDGSTNPVPTGSGWYRNGGRDSLTHMIMRYAHVAAG